MPTVLFVFLLVVAIGGVFAFAVGTLAGETTPEVTEVVVTTQPSSNVQQVVQVVIVTPTAISISESLSEETAEVGGGV